MKYVIGLFISSVGFYLASKHLNQDIREYWDFVAFFVVVLGTFSVMLITFPAVPASILLRRFLQKFFFPSYSLKKHAEVCLAYITERKTQKSHSIELKLLNDGMVLMNSSRNYIKLVSDKLDDKRKMVFSTHLKRLDQTGINFEEQNNWKSLMAKEAQKYFKPEAGMDKLENDKGAESESQTRSA